MLVLLFGFFITDLPCHVLTLQSAIRVSWDILKHKNNYDIKELIVLDIFNFLTLLLTMNLQLHHSRWWSMVCIPSGSSVTTKNDIFLYQYVVCCWLNTSLTVTPGFNVVHWYFEGYTWFSLILFLLQGINM